LVLPRLFLSISKAWKRGGVAAAPVSPQPTGAADFEQLQMDRSWQTMADPDTIVLFFGWFEDGWSMARFHHGHHVERRC